MLASIFAGTLFSEGGALYDDVEFCGCSPLRLK